MSIQWILLSYKKELTTDSLDASQIIMLSGKGQTKGVYTYDSIYIR